MSLNIYIYIKINNNKYNISSYLEELMFSISNSTTVLSLLFRDCCGCCGCCGCCVFTGLTLVLLLPILPNNLPTALLILPTTLLTFLSLSSLSTLLS
ncbi:hypothetical protein RhiirA1_114316 [Rhizophagus irregularis]|uniref:Uncharacterized protein n=1 Tax=Rhizophagus irregularis TaxID=588596 RepID=A0A2I1DUB9_9GLOM|nr:hypothetical protein RhiirA1_114316 [Rhizophagus irregularis]PKY13457.1 hypothetical protein RhiirB3_121150 [Rhizophagus irregularis]